MWFSISVYCPAPGHFVAVFDVITARKEAEAQIRRLNLELEQRVRERTAQLEAANHELEAFSYSVSHDLRAPLRAMDGFASILVEDHAGRLDAEGRRVVGVIRPEATRMGKLIDDLLAFSRASRGQMRSAAIDMTSLARTVFEECAADAPGRSIQFQLDTLLPAIGDPSLVRQVLVNLLSNAIKYTRPRAEARDRTRQPGRREPERLLGQRQRRRLRSEVRRQALRHLPAAASRRGVRGNRRRPGAGPAHRAPARRAGLGRRQAEPTAPSSTSPCPTASSDA